jgi:hypothetical protein
MIITKIRTRVRYFRAAEDRSGVQHSCALESDHIALEIVLSRRYCTSVRRASKKGHSPMTALLLGDEDERNR